MPGPTICQQIRQTDEREGVLGRKTGMRTLGEFVTGVLAGLMTFWLGALVVGGVGVLGLLVVVTLLGGGLVLYWTSPSSTARRKIGMGVIAASLMTLALVAALYAVSGLFHF